MLITSEKLVLILTIVINKMLLRGVIMNKNIKNLKLYKGCLIVVDMVNGFVNEGVLHDEEIRKIVPRQIELIKEAKNDNKLIIFIKDTHSKDSIEFERFGNTTHCLENESESELIPELTIYEGREDTISIEKNSTSFMESPEFRELMENELEMNEFDIVGCCTDICVVNGTLGLANYLDQNNRSHTIRVHTDAVATYAEESRKNYVDAALLLLEQQGVQLVKKNK
jgi:nicotinamidase-related amidase